MQLDKGPQPIVYKPSLRLRLRAAVWAAAVALIPVILFVRLRPWQWYFTGDEFYFQLPWLIAAVVAAAISGFIFGWRLLDAGETHDWRTAAAQSIKVTVWAHGILSTAPLLFVLLTASYAAARDGLPITEIMESINLPALLISPFFFWFGSIMIMGWFTLPVGVTAGYLLSKHYRKGQVSVSAAEN
jgi:hypothetical protein